MSDLLPGGDAERPSQLLDGLRAELEHVYRRATKRDAQEGQRLNLLIGLCKLRFKKDNEVQSGLRMPLRRGDESS